MDNAGEHTDVFDGLAPCGWTRDYERNRLRTLDELRETLTVAAKLQADDNYSSPDLLLDAARAYAQGLNRLRFLSLWEFATKRDSMSEAEAIEGFVELVESSMDDAVRFPHDYVNGVFASVIGDLAADAIDTSAVDAAKEIAGDW